MTTIAPISTVNDLFRRVASAANPRAILWQDEFGQWQPISSDQIYQRVRALGQAFLGWGAKKGDRIALIAENRWEWAITDFAALAIGAADVPIYPTLTGEQIAALLNDADCRIAVVSTRQQFDKLNSVLAMTRLERIVIMDAPAPDGAIAFSSLLAGADDRGSQRDPVFDALVASVEPKDLATLIYTSGTTGEPKGVALTHGNFGANQSFAAADFNFNVSDACISFLPLSHVTARALDYVMFYSAVRQAATGHEGDSAYGDCGRAARVRKNPPGGGATIGGLAREKTHAGLGHRPGRAPLRYGLRRPQALIRCVEARFEAGLLQGARGIWRPRPHFR
jgi:long-chain acyl-CoA synthetase